MSSCILPSFNLLSCTPQILPSSAPSSAPTTNSESGSSGSHLGSGCNTPNCLFHLAEGNAFGATRLMLNFRMMNASPFIPVNAISGSSVSSHSTTEARAVVGLLYLTETFLLWGFSSLCLHFFHPLLKLHGNIIKNNGVCNNKLVYYSISNHQQFVVHGGIDPKSSPPSNTVEDCLKATCISFACFATWQMMQKIIFRGGIDGQVSVTAYPLQPFLYLHNFFFGIKGIAT